MNEFKRTQKIYCVYDKLTPCFYQFCVADNDGLACRTILLSLRVPLKDTELLCLGEIHSEYDVSLNEVPLSCHDIKYYDKPRVIPWSVYKFPDTIAEAVAPLGCTPEEIKQITENKINSVKNAR